MAVRKSVVMQLGGFDQAMGPGSLFRSAEDHDLALRTLRHQGWIYELAQEAVIHNGFRTFEEYKVLTSRDWFAIGAAHAKFMKSLDLKITPIVFYNMVFRCFLHPVTGFFKTGKIQAMRRLLYYIQGMLKGLQTPVDRKTLRYCL